MNAVNSVKTVELKPFVPRQLKALLVVGLIGIGGAPAGFAFSEWMSAGWVAIPPALEGEAMDREAPPLVLKDLKGQLVDLTEVRGKVVFVNFWASWCPPCVRELPSIVELKRSMAGSEFEILAVSEDDSLEDIQTFFKTELPPFPVMLDAQQVVTRAWGTFQYPETYVVNPEGRIVSKFIGGREWNSPEAVAYIRALLP